MKLEFDSLKEFTEMIEAMGYVKSPGEYSITLHAREPRPAADVLRPVLNMTPAELSAEVLRQTADAAEPVSPSIAAEQGNEPAPTGQTEPTKRKRRTKAEMEAARASEQSNAPAGLSETTEAAAQSPVTLANPFEASSSSSTATEAILNAPNGQAATLAGIAAMQTQSPFDPASAQSHSEPVAQTAPATATTVAPAAEPVVVGDAATFLETRSLELLTAGEPIKTVEHMHKCRDFIAKHGQAKYLESFPLAGLTATIGTFKPEQCARHQAALEFLSANA